jgi:molecular chaperone HtpG
MSNQNPVPESIPFKAETRQLLDILIHSLYTEREIFLRELISNASDALTRINFEMLTNRDVLDPDVDLGIYITFDSAQKTLTIRDTGIGMTTEEMHENLGTIAHSGARAFISAVQKDAKNISDIIGQFGVGFYSAFMVAESIQVVSRSYMPDSQAAIWTCTGEDTFTIQPADQESRGTTIILNLKADASEFCQEYRLQEIIRRHSEFISFPIFLGEKPEQVNRQIALWRQAPRNTEKKDYEEFYRQITLEPTLPLTYTHLAIDAPVQMYAVLYVPTSSNRGIFSLRKEDGLKLYSRKILIQEYCKDLLPQHFRFVQGVVDSEDLPLNVARESYQASRVIAQLKSLLTNKVVDMLAKLAEDTPDDYLKFWHEFGVYIKEGVATETTQAETLYPLLRFHTSTHPDTWSSLEDYCSQMKSDQEDIYFLIGDDAQSITHSPHLDYLRQRDYKVLLLTDPIDSFMLIRLTEYKDRALVNIATADLKFPDAEASTSEPDDAATTAPISQEEWLPIVQRFQSQLGEKVASVKMTDRLSDSPARLVDPDGSVGPGLQRVYRYLKEEYEIPKKILELNPSHPIIQNLAAIPAEDSLSKAVIDQIFENALLIEGLHPNPAVMIDRIDQIIQAALKKEISDNEKDTA